MSQSQKMITILIILLPVALYLSAQKHEDTTSTFHSQDAEQITITTYYPSPVGIYNKVVTKALAVGDINKDGHITADDIPDQGSGLLWVANQAIIGNSIKLGTNRSRECNNQIKGTLQFFEDRLWFCDGSVWRPTFLHVATGSYVGDNQIQRKIFLGFRPRIVMIASHRTGTVGRGKKNVLYLKSDSMPGALVQLHGAKSIYFMNRVNITDDGFIVHGNTKGTPNEYNKTFYYTAWE